MCEIIALNPLIPYFLLNERLSGYGYVKVMFMTLNSIFPSPFKNGLRLRLSLMVISKEFVTGVLAIISSRIQIRHSLWYMEVVSCSQLPDVRLSSIHGNPNLTFSDHILKTVSSCGSSLAQISRVKHVFDKNTLIIINALVFSNLFYYLLVWSNAATTNPLKLQAVLNIAAPIISQKV